MGKKISTYNNKITKNYCEVHADYKEELFYIKYYYPSGKKYGQENFPNRTLGFVKKTAKNWANGTKN